MNRRASLGIGALSASLPLFLIVGACVEDNPIVVGHRGDAGHVRQTAVPLPDDPDEDFAGCAHCASIADTSSARNVSCRKNVPSSAALAGTLVQCICYEHCIGECGTYCAGSVQDPGCLQCVLAQCGEKLNACLADVGAP